mgnify:CR=1 FL=1
MNQLFSESTALIVILAAVLGLLLAWVITKKWTADTVARSSQQAQRLLLDAERDADTRKKEIVLAAREKAHELQRTAEEESRIRQAEAVARERALAQEARTIGARRSTLGRRTTGRSDKDRLDSLRKAGPSAGGSSHPRRHPTIG